MNPRRGPVHIFRAEPDLSRISVAYIFPAGIIRHVHGIYKDPYTSNRLWVTVGDNDGECHLYWTDDEFVSLNRLGEGTQRWRAVGLVFTPGHVCWGTDSPHEANHFVRMDRRTHCLEIGQPVPGTVWYAGTTSDGVHYASSSVERGPGVTTRQAMVWASRDGWKWKMVASYEKDAWPMPHFKWGTISFPSGTFHSDEVWISGEAIRGLDGCSTKLNLNESYT